MWRFLIYIFLFSCCRGESTQDMLVNFVRDTVEEINREYGRLDHIRQKSHHTPAFEVGFVLRNMEECYRRMVDIYNSTLTTGLSTFGAKASNAIILLKHVEILYWVIEHLANMLHEVEKKYKIKVAGMFEEQRVWTINTRPPSKPTRFRSLSEISMTTTTKRPRQTWHPLDYGWEMNYQW